MLTKKLQAEYVRWLDDTTGDILDELKHKDEAAIEIVQNYGSGYKPYERIHGC